MRKLNLNWQTSRQGSMRARPKNAQPRRYAAAANYAEGKRSNRYH